METLLINHRSRDVEITEFVRVLDHRFGDGTVYVLRPEDRQVFRFAQELGHIDEEGRLTPVGYKFVATYASSWRESS